MTGELERGTGDPESLAKRASGGRHVRFAMAALGSIPWVGGLLGATAAFQSESRQGQVNLALERWLGEHESKIQDLERAVAGIASRVEDLGEEATQRLDEDEYLVLVRKGFRIWDRVETAEKQSHVCRLLVNAAGTRLSDDDTVRLFLDWIDRFHESHFGIIRAIYRNRGITRLGIWTEMGGTNQPPRENSSEADLFRMLVHDLSTGRVVRQERAVNHRGEFLKKARTRSSGPASAVMKSSFDNVDRYELSELGQEFVHYVLQDAVTRLGDPDPD